MPENKTLNEEIRAISRLPQGMSPAPETWKRIIDAVAKLELALQEKGWIGVETRTPEEHELVLVWVRGGPGTLKGVMRDGGLWEAFYLDGIRPVEGIHCVTHWQPLPPDPPTL